APATIPIAERLMNTGQGFEDNSLKHLQYLLSVTFRPLGIFTPELVSVESGNPNLKRYYNILQDVRRLLLYVFSSSMTQSRNNIALRVVDPSFSLKTNQEANYTIPLDEFESTLIHQTAA
ncbi:hypothetical protein INT46_005485, partial [Mucor plumbeus]